MAIINVELRMMIAERLANDTYTQQFVFNANGETMCIPSSKGRRERYFKQINGIIYEITYDTPPNE